MKSIYFDRTETSNTKWKVLIAGPLKKPLALRSIAGPKKAKKLFPHVASAL